MLSHYKIDVGLIDREVSETGLSIVKPVNFEELCLSARADYAAALRSTKLQPPKRRFSPNDLKVQPWRKLTIGSGNGVGEAYAQFLQTIYFDNDQTQYPGLSRLFKVAIELRNQLMRVASDFGNNPSKDKFWNACRVHHYPPGGGFMMTHCDTYFPLKLGDLPFYQVMIPLSIRGKDFTQGGGVVINKHGEKLNTDEIAGFGSIVVFDGRIQHGVEDVDPDQMLTFDNDRGRMAAFANLYVTLT